MQMQSKGNNVVMICILLSTILSGCYSRGVKTIKEPNADSLILNPVTLSISFWEPGTNREMEIALKQITEKYSKVHPNVSFQLISQPASGYFDWIRARFAANEAPDIEANHSSILERQFKQGFLVNLEDELNRPNPYANNQVWKELFMKGRLEAAHDNLHEPSYAIPFASLGLAYYYNKDIYEKLGLMEPKTWDQFMANCETIVGNQYNPIAMMTLKADAVNWMSWYLTTGLFANKYLADERINPNKDISLDGKEITRAISLGYFDISKGEDKKAYEKYLEMLHQFSKYAQGASGLDEAGAKAQFFAGKAVHIMSGSWDLKGFTENKAFKAGAFSLPRFTKANSEYAGDNFSIPNVEVLGITKWAEESKDKKKAAIDFIKFFTAPDQYKIFIDTTYVIPVINGLDIDPVFNAFTGGAYPALNLFAIGQTGKANFRAASVLAMSGQSYNKDKLANELQKLNIEYAQSVNDRVNEENNFDLKTVMPQGDFKPTDAY